MLIQNRFDDIFYLMPPWYHDLDKYLPSSAKDGDEQLEQAPPNKKFEAKRPPDATLDLHGMTQEQAHGALKHLLKQAHRHQWTKLLIIHGKGLHSESGAVLKKLVYYWAESQKGLRLEKAPARLGGSGASLLYLSRK